MSSSLKRRLQRTKELEEIKDKLRRNLPVLDQRQIRRFVLINNLPQSVKYLIKITFKPDIG